MSLEIMLSKRLSIRPTIPKLPLFLVGKLLQFAQIKVVTVATQPFFKSYIKSYPNCFILFGWFTAIFHCLKPYFWGLEDRRRDKAKVPRRQMHFIMQETISGGFSGELLMFFLQKMDGDFCWMMVKFFGQDLSFGSIFLAHLFHWTSTYRHLQHGFFYVKTRVAGYRHFHHQMESCQKIGQKLGLKH